MTKLKMMLQLPWRFTLLSVLFATLSLSCSSDPDSEPDPIPTPGSASNSSAGYAPKSVVGKEFRFYRNGEDEWQFKAIATKDPSSAKISAKGGQYIVVSNPYFYYDKTGKNTADVLCSFYYAVLGFVGNDQIFDYVLELTFLSENHGTYTGTLSHYKTSDDSQDVSGVFVYDSTKKPSQF